MYAAIGHPRHTVYVPIPIVAENIPVVMKKRKWLMKAFTRLDQLGLDASIPSGWTKFEKESMNDMLPPKPKPANFSSPEKKPRLLHC